MFTLPNTIVADGPNGLATSVNLDDDPIARRWPCNQHGAENTFNAGVALMFVDAAVANPALADGLNAVADGLAGTLPDANLDPAVALRRTIAASHSTVGLRTLRNRSVAGPHATPPTKGFCGWTELWRLRSGKWILARQLLARREQVYMLLSDEQARGWLAVNEYDAEAVKTTPVPVAETTAPEEFVLSADQTALLLAAYRRDAFDSDRRVNSATLAKTTEIANDGARRCLRSLTVQKLFNSERGPNGGYWLTDLGRARAEKIDGRNPAANRPQIGH